MVDNQNITNREQPAEEMVIRQAAGYQNQQICQRPEMTKITTQQFLDRYHKMSIT